MESSENDERGGGAGKLKDPMSGYASADELGARRGGGQAQSGEAHVDPVKDSMSGYASADVMDTRPKVDPEGTDKIHTDALKDSMSGYASADAFGPEKADALGRDKNE